MSTNEPRDTSGPQGQTESSSSWWAPNRFKASDADGNKLAWSDAVKETPPPPAPRVKRLGEPSIAGNLVNMLRSWIPSQPDKAPESVPEAQEFSRDLEVDLAAEPYVASLGDGFRGDGPDPGLTARLPIDPSFVVEDATALERPELPMDSAVMAFRRIQPDFHPSFQPTSESADRELFAATDALRPSRTTPPVSFSDVQSARLGRGRTLDRADFAAWGPRLEGRVQPDFAEGPTRQWRTRPTMVRRPDAARALRDRPIQFYRNIRSVVARSFQRSVAFGNPDDARDVLKKVDVADSRFQLDVPALGKELFVREFDGLETVSELYHFELTVLSTDPNLPVEDVLNQRVQLSIKGPDGDFRPYSGILRGFRQTGQYVDTFMYKADLVPTVWRLSLNYQTRVFQNMTVDAIVTSVMEQVGLASGADFEFRLERQLPIREYTTQYRETDLNFVRRLLEHEGIHFYFEQGEKGETMVMTDRSPSNPTIEGNPSVPFNQARGMVSPEGHPEVEVITDLVYQASLVTGRVILKDYNYETPNKDMLVDSQINDHMPGTYYEYGDHFKDRDEGQALAEIRNQEIESRRITLSGSGTCTRLRAGHKMLLVGHFRDELNASYFLTSIRHSGAQTGGHLGPFDSTAPEGAPDQASHLGYRNEFTCVPARISYRPARKTAPPQLPGIMTARIESAGGDYAYIDDDGRYRVKMPFDLDETPEGGGSKPIRLAQPYSGPDYGIHFPHHENTEMIWACVDGNVDRPLGLGTAPNPNNDSPATARNRPQNVIRTWGQNELTFDDTVGQENILMIATKDHTVEVANDESFTVDHDQTTHVKNDRSVTVDNDETKEVKNDQTIDVLNDRTKTVKNDETNRIENKRDTTVVAGETLTVDSGGREVTVSSGDQTTTISSGNRTTTVQGNDAHTVQAGNRTVTVSAGDDNLTVQGSRVTQIQSGTYLLDVGGDSARLVCGASSITLGADGTITLSGNHVNIDAANTCGISADQIESKARVRGLVSAPDMFVKGDSIAAVQSPKVELNGSSSYT